MTLSRFDTPDRRIGSKKMIFKAGTESGHLKLALMGTRKPRPVEFGNQCDSATFGSSLFVFSVTLRGVRVDADLERLPNASWLVRVNLNGGE